MQLKDRVMKILILGGTGFIGPHEVDQCEDRGWEITIFNRGRTKTMLFEEDFAKVDRLKGDRDPKVGDGLKSIERAVASGRTWDAVIDNSAYVPRIARASAELLKDAVRQYVFISTVSVYASNNVPDQDETSELGTLDDETTEKVTNTTYGPLKVACEKAVREIFGERATIIRPGLIVGPGDKSDRFTCWPVRCQRGGKVVIPESSPRVQYIDVGDLATFTLDTIEGGHGGTYNVVGPIGPLFFREMLDGCKAAVSSPVEFVEIPDAFLLEYGVNQFAGPNSLGMWVAPIPDNTSFGHRSNARAVAIGLTCRPLAETARATVDWFENSSRAGETTLRSGLSPEKEKELLKAWSEQSKK